MAGKGRRILGGFNVFSGGCSKLGVTSPGNINLRWQSEKCYIFVANGR